MSKSTGLTSIRVGGRNVSLRFCLWALRQACRNLGITLEDFFDKLEQSETGKISIFEMMDFYAETMKEAANHELEPGIIPYTTKCAYGWIDEMGITSDAFKGVVTVLMESITYQMTGMSPEEAKKQADAQKLAANEDTKKKPTGGKR